MLRKNRTHYFILLLIFLVMSSILIVALSDMRPVVGIDETQHQHASTEMQTHIDDQTTICLESREPEKNDDSYKMSSVAIFILCVITIVALLGALSIKYNLSNPD